MTKEQKREVKQTARKLYQERRITLKMAIWAMKNAGYTREETVKWLELPEENINNGGLDHGVQGQEMG